MYWRSILMPRVLRRQPVLQQGERVLEQWHQINVGELILLAARIRQKIGDDAVQPFRLPGHNLQKLTMFVAQVGDLGKHAYRTGNRSQRIADFVRDGRRQTSHCGKPVLNTQIPLQAPNFSEVIEGINVAHVSPPGTEAVTRSHEKSCGSRSRRQTALRRERVLSSTMGNGSRRAARGCPGTRLRPLE